MDATMDAFDIPDSLEMENQELDESMFDPDDENPPPSWTPPQESSLEDTRVRSDAEQVLGFTEITYQLVQEGTIRGKVKLVTNTGYSYNIRKRRPNGTIDWQCTLRRKDFRCKASVIQRDGKFSAGQHQHSHPGAIGALTAAAITARVKQIAREEIFRPTSAFVNEVLLENRIDDNPCPALSKPENIIRTTNRMR
ncbi:uncharacterized protein [Montipora capricornis]|uniref:uncharacterized protein n=1 Tax=Montipora capricornis TaxID=246305 RepID=UPI0035F21786